MKTLISTLFILCISFSVSYSQHKDKTTISLGEVAVNDSVKVDWQVSNNSLKPIVIVGFQTDCECSTIEYSQSPILPDSSRVVSIKYFADNKGNFFKNLSLNFSDGSKQYVVLVGKVVKR